MIESGINLLLCTKASCIYIVIGALRSRVAREGRVPAIWQQGKFQCCFQINRQSAEAVERGEASLPALLQGSHQREELRGACVQWRLHCLW